MKYFALILLAFTQFALADFAPKTALKDLCADNRPWFITANTDDGGFNGWPSCVSDWKETIVIKLDTFCEANSDVVHAPQYRCRFLENGKVIQDWHLCNNGSKYEATDSCGKYEIEVYALGNTNSGNKKIESNSATVMLEFFAD